MLYHKRSADVHQTVTQQFHRHGGYYASHRALSSKSLLSCPRPDLLVIAVVSLLSVGSYRSHLDKEKGKKVCIFNRVGELPLLSESSALSGNRVLFLSGIPRQCERVSHGAAVWQLWCCRPAPKARCTTIGTTVQRLWAADTSSPISSPLWRLALRHVGRRSALHLPKYRPCPVCHHLRGFHNWRTTRSDKMSCDQRNSLRSLTVL